MSFGVIVVEHRDDVPWHLAPPPFVLHLHFAQTTGFGDDGTITQRCPCGAFGNGRGLWTRLDRRRVRWLP